MHHWFAHPLILPVLALLLPLGLLAGWSAHRRRLALSRLGLRTSLGLLLAQPRRWRRLRGLCMLFGLIALGVGMAGPQWGRDWQQSAAPGRDLVVVLDCSKSMLAETPTRLERARLALLDLVDAIQRRGGHRLALVAFAGRARLMCPLTHDYDHFRTTLETINQLPFDPELSPAGNAGSGTRIGLGLIEGLLTHDTRFEGARDVLLLSDGDDPARDGEWQDGIDKALALKIPVHVVGIGDPDQAWPIRIGSTVLRHDDKEVRSQLQETPLQTITKETHGQYWPSRTLGVPLGHLYLDHIAARPVREQSDDTLPLYQQRYLWFLLPAFGLLVCASLLGDRPVRFRGSLQ
jgi:Ca-activated chloride channel family protein